MNPKSILMASLGLAAAVGFGAARKTGAADTQLRSEWARSPVTIDGSAAEWAGNLTYVKELKSYVGIRNDTQNLYLCIQSADSQTTRQEVGGGLLIRLDPEGGKEHALGVRYPVGFFGSGGGGPEGERGGGDEGGPPSEGRPEGGPEGRPEGSPEVSSGRERWNRQDLVDRSLGQVEILGPGKDDRNILALRELHEVMVAYGSPGGVGVYELKIALHSTPQNSFALDAAAGKPVKLELETGRRGGRRGPGGGGEGRPGGRGGWGGGGGGWGRGGGRPPGEGGDGGWGRPPGDGGMGGGGRSPGGGRFRRGEPIHGSIKFLLAPASSGSGGH